MLGLLTIPGNVIARLGPWLMRAGGSVGPKAVEAVQKAGATGIASVGDIVTYAKTNPTNAALVFTSLASAGFAVSDLFSPADKQDQDARSSATALAVAEAAAVDAKLIDIAGASEELGGISGNKQDLVTLQRILRFARGHYGSATAATEAWKSHQAFFELSLKDVETGFAILDI